MLTKRQRDMLERLRVATESLGNRLDGTATHPAKYIQRQKANRYTSNVIYGVMVDHPDNEDRDEAIEQAELNLQMIEFLVNANYSDRNGNGLLTPIPEHLQDIL